MSTTPAFSPGPWMTRGPVVGNFFRWTREDLYEQCSLHIAEKMPSSTRLGSRPRISRMLRYSASERLCSLTSSVGDRHRVASAATALWNILIPWSLPRSVSEQRSGCGIRPTTLPSRLQMPAMLRTAPFGFDASVTSPSGSQ